MIAIFPSFSVFNKNIFNPILILYQLIPIFIILSNNNNNPIFIHDFVSFIVLSLSSSLTDINYFISNNDNNIISTLNFIFLIPS